MSIPGVDLPDNRIQLKALALAQADGVITAKMTPELFTFYSLKARSLGEIVRDGANAAVSIGMTKLGVRNVSLKVLEANKKKCESNICMKFGRLADQSPVCFECDCHGMALESKQADKAWYCPLGYWDNRTAVDNPDETEETPVSA